MQYVSVFMYRLGNQPKKAQNEDMTTSPLFLCEAAYMNVFFHELSLTE